MTNLPRRSHAPLSRFARLRQPSTKYASGNKSDIRPMAVAPCERKIPSNTSHMAPMTKRWVAGDAAFDGSPLAIRAKRGACRRCAAVSDPRNSTVGTFARTADYVKQRIGLGAFHRSPASCDVSQLAQPTRPVGPNSSNAFLPESTRPDDRRVDQQARRAGSPSGPKGHWQEGQTRCRPQQHCAIAVRSRGRSPRLLV